MREILFRGKVTGIPLYLQDKTKIGTWVYGSYVSYPVAQIFDLEDEYIVDPATVGQYTGLCDKNGVRIFEGDIVDIWSAGQHCHGLVKWGQGSVSFFVEVPCTPHIWHLSGGGKNYDEETCEVIGNLQDSPELLNEEESK